MRKRTKKKAWFFDIDGNLCIEQFDEDRWDGLNSGDYHTHDWGGPYKTFAGAKRAGLKLLRSELNMALYRYQAFASRKEKK